MRRGNRQRRRGKNCRRRSGPNRQNTIHLMYPWEQRGGGGGGADTNRTLPADVVRARAHEHHPEIESRLNSAAPDGVGNGYMPIVSVNLNPGQWAQ